MTKLGIALSKTDKITTNEEILSITFKVKEGAQLGETKMDLKEMLLAVDDTAEIEPRDAEKIIEIVESKVIPEDDPEKDPEDKPIENALLESIEITKKPNKTEYKVGEKFDKTGMVVNAIYSDGTSKEVTNYTYNPTDALKVNNAKITISYTEGTVTKTADQKITVKDGTTANKNFGNEGLETYAIPFSIIILITIISIIELKKYKNI